MRVPVHCQVRERDSLWITETIKLLNEADRLIALLRSVIVPLVATYCDAVVACQAFLATGGNEFLTPAA